MKRVISTCLTLCLSAALALPASALDYSIDAPGNPDYGDPTSIEVVHTADGGAMKNEDISKNAALIPPSFGSPSADALGTGTYLTPNLAPGGMAVGTISGGNMPIVFPPTSGENTGNTSSGSSGGSSTSGGYTYVTDDLYYSGGYLGTLKISAIGLSVKIYQGTGSSTLAKGAGHFTDTSTTRTNHVSIILSQSKRNSRQSRTPLSARLIVYVWNWNRKRWTPPTQMRTKNQEKLIRPRHHQKRIAPNSQLSHRQ